MREPGLWVGLGWLADVDRAAGHGERWLDHCFLLACMLTTLCSLLIAPLPCSACRAVWYCGTACSHADWRAGHRRVCKALGAARAAEKERRRQAAAAQAADEQGDI